VSVRTPTGPDSSWNGTGNDREIDDDMADSISEPWVAGEDANHAVMVALAMLRHSPFLRNTGTCINGEESPVMSPWIASKPPQPRRTGEAGNVESFSRQPPC